MSRRIDIELTSVLGDGTWTWRAAGARQPRGTLDGAILPGGAKVGDELKVEVEQELDGIVVLSVVAGREKHDPDLLTLLPVEREFQPVIETRAGRERGERPRRSDGDRRPRNDDGTGRDRPRTGGKKPEGGERRSDRDRPKTDRPARERSGEGGRPPSREGREGGRPRERRGPSFTPPPEVPQRPKPKRLRPGKTHRTAVLAELPPEQRPIAELALQGMGAVRSRLHEENARAAAEGRAAMPETSVMKMAEELLPTLRVAEWRDRAEAAKAQAAELDLRDLRSVVAASGDPMVARDETTRALADELKQLLTTKQEQELQFWYGDIDAALAVGRVIRALRLSSQPPKAGVPFPSDIAQRLADSANASLTPMDAPDRWAAMLEAAAFSPVRALVRPTRKPDAVNDELMATVTRLAPALPQVAELFEVVVPTKAVMPKPLRPGPRPSKGKDQTGDRPKRGDKPRPPKPPKPEVAAETAEDKPADTGATKPEQSDQAIEVQPDDGAGTSPDESAEAIDVQSDGTGGKTHEQSAEEIDVQPENASPSEENVSPEPDVTSEAEAVAAEAVSVAAEPVVVEPVGAEPVAPETEPVAPEPVSEGDPAAAP
jgi:hypothetical protein